MKGSSPAARGSSDTRLFSLLRELKDRVRALENRPKTTIGGWRLHEDGSGNLVATRGEVTRVVASATLTAEEAP